MKERMKAMKLFTARYGNKNLNNENFCLVRISLGSPKWNTGYRLDGEMKDLMPFGLFREYDTYEEFLPAYFKRLDSIGIDRIQRQLEHFGRLGKDVVLLCFEDIRKAGEWCHRTAFAEWYRSRTGKTIEELPEVAPREVEKPQSVQTSIFDFLK